MIKPDLAKVKRVLIIRARAIGDVILTTPMIRAIRKSLPNAEIDYLVEPFAEPALSGNPNITNIILFKRHDPKRELPSVTAAIKKAAPKGFGGFGWTIGLYAFLFARKYDLVFDLWGNLRTSLLSYLTGAKYRAGFNFRGRKYFYNLRYEPDIKTKYNVYYHMDLLKTAGIPEDGEQTEFYTSKEDDKFADEFIFATGSRGRLIGISAVGSWKTKRWPPKKFAALMDAFIRDNKENRFIVFWGPGEKDLAETVVKFLKEEKKNIFLPPETSVKQMAAIMKKLDLLVTNDGAAQHIAVALGTPAITIYGPTNYKAWGPADNPRHLEVHSSDKCAPCDRMACDNFICMENISVEDVLEKSLKLLAKGRD
jgi:ADP-heptose:LPS heptosyltransferase